MGQEMTEMALVKELRDQAAKETKTADNPFVARKERVEWRSAEELERLRSLLERCRTVLGNMALENEGSIFDRWPISHEPLRADAKNLVPLIDAALER